MNNKPKIWMNQAMHYMMLSCDTATFYIVKAEYQKLSCKENLQLKAHLMGCKFCRAFNRQNAILSDKIKILQQDPPKAELSPAKKAEIGQALKSK
ncbi:MAG: hypothetical protein RQ761_12740 [Bacteroidales bacterium]|nr:hypothetical protein [Bacteroidales bacterium]